MGNCPGFLGRTPCKLGPSKSVIVKSISVNVNTLPFGKIEIAWLHSLPKKFPLIGKVFFVVPVP